MLRIHFLQHWFARIDWGTESGPDETTICRYRHLLEKHNLGTNIMKIVNAYLAKNGFRVFTGTIVDATIIAGPSSTKNAEVKRDPEMYLTRKGNQWYFGMKLHISVDSKEDLIHSVAITPANVHDSQMPPELLTARCADYMLTPLTPTRKRKSNRLSQMPKISRTSELIAMRRVNGLRWD